MLAREVDVRMAHAVVPCERVRPAERLVLGAQVASDFLLARVVDRVLVPRQVVRPREDRVTRLARARVDPVAPMRACLRVEEDTCRPCEAYLRSVRCCAGGAVRAVRRAMPFALVLLEEDGRLEALCAPVICACVGASVCVRAGRSLYWLAGLN